jgi:hypothetical protein
LLQQCRRKQGIAGFTALAALDPHAHAVSRAVDVFYAQGADLGYAQARGVNGLK